MYKLFVIAAVMAVASAAPGHIAPVVAVPVATSHSVVRTSVVHPAPIVHAAPLVHAPLVHAAPVIPVAHSVPVVRHRVVPVVHHAPAIVPVVRHAPAVVPVLHHAPVVAVHH